METFDTFDLYISTLKYILYICCFCFMVAVVSVCWDELFANWPSGDVRTFKKVLITQSLMILTIHY